MKPGKLDREADGCIYDRYLPIWSRKEKSIVGRSKLEAHQSGLVDTYFFFRNLSQRGRKISNAFLRQASKHSRKMVWTSGHTKRW